MLSSTLINVGGTSHCPFPLHTPNEVIGFSYFQSLSSLFFLALIYVTYMGWQLTCFISWYISFHCHRADPIERCSSACCTATNRHCPSLARLMRLAATPQAFRKSLLAFVLTAYEPFMEQTLQFMSCTTVAGVRVVSRRPDVQCSAHWEVRFIPALLVVFIVPIVLFWLLARALHRPCELRTLLCGCVTGARDPAPFHKSARASDEHASSEVIEPFVLLSSDDGRYAPLVDAKSLTDATPQSPSTPVPQPVPGHGEHGGSALLMLSHHFHDRLAPL